MSCLDEDTLFAFARGSLGDADRSRAEEHIDECSTCRRLLAELALEGDAPAQRASFRPAGDSAAVTRKLPALQEAGGGGELVPGTVVGENYLIDSPIGRGGMGTVYLARDQRLDRPVALKLISREMLRSPSLVQRFVFEARVTARFSHPNIISIYGAGEFDGRPYLALEYVSGETLAERMQRPPPLSREQVLDIALSLARALAEAHRHGVLHRDLKPANAMVTSHGQVRVLDFGLARLLEQRAAPLDALPLDALLSDALPLDALLFDGAPHASMLELHYTRVSGPKGTPSYMAPEQWRGEKVTSAVDIWAFGLILYELSFERYPFRLDGLRALREQILSPEAVAVPPSSGPYADLRRLVCACLEKDPSRRPSAEQVVDELEHLRLKATRKGRPRRAGLALALSLPALLFVAALWYAGQLRPSSRASRRVGDAQALVVASRPALQRTSVTEGPSPARVAPPERSASQPVRADLAPETRRSRPRIKRQRLSFARLNIQATERGEPRAVVVVLDGRVVGETPLQLAKVSSGRHYLTVRHELYRTARRVVVLDGGKTETVLFKLEERAGAGF